MELSEDFFTYNNTTVYNTIYNNITVYIIIIHTTEFNQQESAIHLGRIQVDRI